MTCLKRAKVCVELNHGRLLRLSFMPSCIALEFRKVKGNETDL